MKSLLTSLGLAIGVATIILVTLILPAEYGIDPLGTGRWLGLSRLTNSSAGINELQTGSYNTDRFEFTLAPFESLEYKYRLEAHAAVVYSWSASEAVVFDLHAEPDGAEAGYAESFETGREAKRNGTYTAPFSGIHGWFFENRSQTDVKVVLNSAGFFNHAKEFRGGGEFEYRFAVD
ncbi:MAG: hypothetical protein O3A63_07245 [Proteobacteria bacterium]|nr:hypothetical protein [Pseudomonadota bacterium]